MTIDLVKYDSSKGTIIVYKLTNKNGAIVELSSIGAGIISIYVPDNNGTLNDIVLGYNNITDYIYDGPCLCCQWHICQSTNYAWKGS